MAPFFGFKGKPKTPEELVSKTRASLQALATAAKGKEVEKAGKDATEHLAMLLQCFPVHKATHEASVDVDATMAALLKSDVVPLMVTHLSKLHFETRKTAVDIFQYVCKYQHPDSGWHPGLAYVRQRAAITRALVLGYEDAAVALNCGQMARFAIGRDAATARGVLLSDLRDKFFDYVQKNAFEVASDAFNTFKVLLVQHKEVTTSFLEDAEHFDDFFAKYDALLVSENYATQRQSLSLLAQLLMETFLGHEALLFKYIHSAARLMTIMNLLRAKSRSIQFEAFHVFKVFVANPRKPDVVTGILISNRDKLLRFLTLFLQEREEDDETFAAEKRDIMSEIEGLSHHDPAYKLKPSASMQRGMSTSMSFSALPGAGGGGEESASSRVGGGGGGEGGGGGGETAASEPLPPPAAQ